MVLSVWSWAHFSHYLIYHRQTDVMKPTGVFKAYMKKQTAIEKILVTQEILQKSYLVV